MINYFPHVDTYIEVYFSILKKKLILGSSNFKINKRLRLYTLTK